MCSGCGLQVRKVAEENGVDVSTQIAELEMRAQQVLLLLYVSSLPLYSTLHAWQPLALMQTCIQTTVQALQHVTVPYLLQG